MISVLLWILCSLNVLIHTHFFRQTAELFLLHSTHSLFCSTWDLCVIWFEFGSSQVMCGERSGQSLGSPVARSGGRGDVCTNAVIGRSARTCQKRPHWERARQISKREKNQFSSLSRASGRRSLSAGPAVRGFGSRGRGVTNSIRSGPESQPAPPYRHQNKPIYLLQPKPSSGPQGPSRTQTCYETERKRVGEKWQNSGV